MRQFDFVNFDDPDYVSRNVHVQQGMTPDGIAWAFNSGEAANWFPVTWLSHMLDVQVFGLRSGWHHLSSVLFHALAAMLLFGFLHRATHAPWPSALVAFLFALHPLHVESVAWVAERKDVLNAFFWFLTLWAYVRYAERPAWGLYLLTLGAFCLGLLAKPMIITLPIVLLLLDWWPLRRWSAAALREKMPFFVLSAGVAVVTYLVQQGSGAVEPISLHPLGVRVQNAVLSYAVYIAEMFWPSKLAVFYPYPADFPVWRIAVAALLLGGISILVFHASRAYPYLVVGWLWFLVTLLPVIGLVQVGAQARADRYMYVPMVGLTIMMAWGAADVIKRWPPVWPAVAALAVAGCLFCSALTRMQVQYWKNSETLFQHALDVTSENYLAEHNLGTYLTDVPGRLPEAIQHLEASLRIQPNSAKAHTDLGSALAKTPDGLSGAVAEYQAALRIAPDSAIPHNNLGNVLSKLPGRLSDAISEYETALRLNPDYAEARSNLGVAHNNLGNALAELPSGLPGAISQYEAALQLNPNDPEARNGLGSAFAQMGRLPEAISQYQAALRIEPGFAEAHYNLGVALSKAGRTPEAIAQFEAALQSRPDYAEAHNNLGVALGNPRDAIPHFEAALRINPDYADAHVNLGIALSQVPGRLPEALKHFDAALRIKPDPEIQQIVNRLRAR